MGTMLPSPETVPGGHVWVPSRVGHGEYQCRFCHGTNREIAVIEGRLDGPCNSRPAESAAENDPIKGTFTALREANIARQAEWPGGEKVDLAFRGIELTGEIGELEEIVVSLLAMSTANGRLSNKLKKLVRLDRGIHGTSEAREALLADIRDEMGDIVVSLDLVAMDLGIDLGRATREKFNKTSVKQGLQTRMKE